MSVDDGTIAVAVYLPRERQGTLEELLSRGGIAPQRSGDRGWVHARWDAAALHIEAYLEEREDHRLMWIKLSENEWLAQRPEPADSCPQEADGGMALVYALRALCVALEPDVAMFLSHRWQDEDWLDGEDWAVLANDIDTLLALRVGALYVNDEIAGFLDDVDTRLEGRERVATERGLMVLAGTGWGRFS